MVVSQKNILTLFVSNLRVHSLTPISISSRPCAAAAVARREYIGECLRPGMFGEIEMFAIQPETARFVAQLRGPIFSRSRYILTGFLLLLCLDLWVLSIGRFCAQGNIGADRSKEMQCHFQRYSRNVLRVFFACVAWRCRSHRRCCYI